MPILIQKHRIFALAIVPNNKLSLNFMESKKEIILLNVEGCSWDFGVPADSIIPFLHSVFKNDGDLHRVTIKDIYFIIER